MSLIDEWIGFGLAGSLAAGFLAVAFAVVGLCAASETFRRLLKGRNGKGRPAAPVSDLSSQKSPGALAEQQAADTIAMRPSLFPDLIYWGFPAVWAVLFLSIAVGWAALAIAPFRDNVAWIIAYLFVFSLGGSVGAAELVSRYRDNPVRALLTAPAIFYMSLNAFGSVAALYLIWLFHDKLGFKDSGNVSWADDAGNIVQAVMIAGFSSLLFFRTSLFKFRVGNADLPIGPSIVLDALLGAADRAVDRVMANPRAELVQNLMSSISFDKAVVMLPGLCVALMQNLSSEESQRIAGVVNRLRADKETPNKIKTFNLGLELLTVVGENVLKTAVQGLNTDLQDSTAKLVKEVPAVMAGVLFDGARRMLPPYCFALWPNEVPADAQQKLMLDLKAMSELSELPDEYKSLLLGIRLARLTDGDTLRKAVDDLAGAIKKPAPPPPAGAAVQATAGG